MREVLNEYLFTDQETYTYRVNVPGFAGSILLGAIKDVPQKE